jgi:hypothetical protein
MMPTLLPRSLGTTPGSDDKELVLSSPTPRKFRYRPELNSGWLANSNGQPANPRVGDHHPKSKRPDNFQAARYSRPALSNASAVPAAERVVRMRSCTMRPLDDTSPQTRQIFCIHQEPTAFVVQNSISSSLNNNRAIQQRLQLRCVHRF